MLFQRATADVSRAILAAVVLGTVVVTAVPSQSVAQPASYVTRTGTGVNVVATGAPLNAVLRELALQTGSRIVGLEQATEPVTVDIRDAHVSDALRALLADARVNYLYILRSTPTPAAADRVTLWLYGPSSRPERMRASQTDVVGPTETTTPVGYLATVAEALNDDEVTRLHRDGAFDSKATEASLMSLAKSPNHEVRILALQSLALQSSPLGLETIRAALKDENPFVRGEAMGLLASLGQGPAGVAQLGALIAHEDPEVRGVAVMALGEQTGDEAQALLERALEDGDGAVRGFAARALQQKQASEKPKR
jgi:HEAT repeat protein